MHGSIWVRGRSRCSKPAGHACSYIGVQYDVRTQLSSTDGHWSVHELRAPACIVPAVTMLQLYTHFQTKKHFSLSSSMLRHARPHPAQCTFSRPELDVCCQRIDIPLTSLTDYTSTHICVHSLTIGTIIYRSLADALPLELRSGFLYFPCLATVLPLPHWQWQVPFVSYKTNVGALQVPAPCG